MNGQALVADQPRELASLDQITTEIVLLKQQTAMNIIEIGRRLLQAKEQLPHGQWGSWLREQVEFSQATANRFMQVATEFSNSSALRNLNPTKVYSLLELPAADREEFIASPHLVASGEVKMVDDMTTRELQQAIKERDQARNEARKALQAAEAGRATAERERELAKAREDELHEARRQVQQLQEASQQPVTLEPVIIERVPAEVEQELHELRRMRDSSANPPCESEIKYRLQFDSLVAGFRGILTSLEDLKSADIEAHAQYKRALLGLLAKMQSTLE